MTIYSKPMSRVEVVPDGNCFFRSICYWLTGTMDQHHKVRLAVVSFMKEKWSEQGKRIVGKHFQTYLTKFKMDDDGTWATETEIFATADLLKTTIMVLPKVKKTQTILSAKKLYLINECNHYDLLLDYVNKKDTHIIIVLKVLYVFFCAISDYAIHFCYR